MITKEELAQLRSQMPKRYLKRIKEITGHAECSISSVMNGKWYNEEIIDAAFTILAEHKDKLAQQKELLAK